MKYTDITKCNPFSNKMEIDFHMLGVLVLHRVGRHVDGTDVVAVNQGGLAQGSVQFSQQLAQPGGLGDGIGDRPVFSFGTGPGDRVLALRGLGDEAITEKDSITGGGLACIRAACPVCI
jgi:hypothetical protein